MPVVSRNGVTLPCGPVVECFLLTRSLIGSGMCVCSRWNKSQYCVWGRVFNLPDPAVVLFARITHGCSPFKSAILRCECFPLVENTLTQMSREHRAAIECFLDACNEN